MSYNDCQCQDNGCMCGEYANTWSYEYGIVCGACKDGYHSYPHLLCQCNVAGCTCLQYPQRVYRYTHDDDQRCLGCRQGTHHLSTVKGSLQGSSSRGRPSDYSDELPPDHFWDSAEAEQEYYELVEAIAQAQEKLQEKLSAPQSRLLTHQAVYNCFSGVPGVAAALSGSSTSASREYEDKALSDALNPYWLNQALLSQGRDGRAFCEFAQGQGSLIVQNVESETFSGTVKYARWIPSGCTDSWFDYSYEKRVEWYKPIGDAALSLLEWALLGGRKVFTPPLPPDRTADYSALLDGIVQELHTLIAPLTKQIVLTFYPNLTPTNIEYIDVSVSHGKPRLNYPYLARYSAPKAGERYGPASYEGTHWLMCGRWEPHRFPPEELEAVRKRIHQIDDRLRERVDAATSEVKAVEEEIAALRRRRDAVRTRHYPQLTYEELWSSIQNTGRQDSA